MLKKIMGVFFPSFTWEYGFALWSVGDAVGIGASVAGGLFGDDANDDAAKAIDKSNAQIQQMIKEQQGSNDSAYSPYRNAGNWANQRLGYLLGYDDTSGPRALTASEVSEAAGKGYDQGYRFGNATREQIMQNAVINWRNGDYGDDTNTRKLFEIPEPEQIKLDKSDGQFGSLLSKFTNADMEGDAVYNTGLQFGLDEGVKGLNRRAASGGAYDSGATLKALTRYANDYGTTKAEGAYNRFMNDKNTTYGFLSGQQGVGLNATDRNQSLNTGLLGQAIGAQQNAASQQAGYGVQGAAALNNGVMSGIGNYLYSSRMGNGGINGGTPGINGGASYPGYAYGSSSIPWYA
jgi:hypothetical protein